MVQPFLLRRRGCLVFESQKSLENVIVGFVIQNKKGQTLLNTNSLVTGDKTTFCVEERSLNRVEFIMQMPFLSSDEYLLDCAVAQGTNINDSKMLTWLYGALRVFVENPMGNLGIFDINTKVKVYNRKL